MDNNEANQDARLKADFNQRAAEQTRAAYAHLDLTTIFRLEEVAEEEAAEEAQAMK